MFLRQWTISAIYCYERGCRCKGCYYAQRIETRCVMKQTVIELVKLYGKPKYKLSENER